MRTKTDNLIPKNFIFPDFFEDITDSENICKRSTRLKDIGQSVILLEMILYKNLKIRLAIFDIYCGLL